MDDVEYKWKGKVTGSYRNEGEGYVSGAQESRNRHVLKYQFPMSHGERHSGDF